MLDGACLVVCAVVYILFSKFFVVLYGQQKYGCRFGKYLVNPRPARGGGRGGAKYLGPGLVRGPEILVKCLVMGATVKMVEGP